MEKPNIKQSQDLFAQVIACLGGTSDIGGAIPKILERVCRFFNMSCAFIYESDSMGVLQLKEFFSISGAKWIPEQITLTDIISPEGIELPIRKKFIHDCEWAKYREDFCANLKELFKAKTMIAVPIFDSQNELIGISGLASDENVCIQSDEDISTTHLVLHVLSNQVELRFYQAKLELSKQSLESTLDNLGIDIYVTDYHTKELLYANKSMAATFGGVDNMIGKTCWEDAYNSQMKSQNRPKEKLVDAEGNPTKPQTWDYMRPSDGEWFRVFSSAFKWVDGRIAHVVSTINTTEYKRNEFLIEKMAFIDTLTNVPNRRKFERDFQQALGRCTLDGKSGYVLFLDLDNFKYINDAFGHEMGDQLLIQVASYVDNDPICRGHFYRYGGDEFILFFEDIERSMIADLTDSIIKRFRQPWFLGEREYFCTVSVGVACYPKDGVTYDSLLHAADTAMYKAKNNGKSTVAFYEDDSDENFSANLEKEFALRHAVVAGFKEFALLFNPIIDAKTGEWIGAEALLRWNSSKYGLMEPENFIETCESLGLIVTLGKWVMETALKHILDWGILKKKKFFISMNISMKELQEDDFDIYLKNTLERLNYPADAIMLEVTETMVAVNLNHINAKLASLREIGVRVAIDGFGTGYSSLHVMRNLGVDVIKIDRMFVKDCMDDEFKSMFVTTIVMLAHTARFSVCAEGVENEDIKKFLQDANCDYLQGAYFSMPMPIETLILAELDEK